MPASSYAARAIEARKVAGRGFHGDGGVRGDVREVEHGVGVARCHRRHRADPYGGRRPVPSCEIHARQYEGGAPVGRRTDVEQPQRVGDDGGARHLFGRDPLAVPRVRVQRPQGGVLHLDLREVLQGVPVHGHPPPRVQPEVRRVRRSEDPEPQPVGIVRPVPARRTEESLGRSVGADHEDHVREARKDLRSRRVDGLRPRRTGGVHTRDPRSLPAQGLRERRSRHVPRIAACARCRRPRPSRCPASRPPRRPAPHAPPRPRTRRIRAPTCPTGACPRRAPPPHRSCRHPRTPHALHAVTPVGRQCHVVQVVSSSSFSTPGTTSTSMPTARSETVIPGTV